VRETDEPFRSALWGGMRRRTEVLERLIVEMYVRGLSTRDIEDALADLAPGEDVLLGRSSVSRITDRLSAEYEQFCARDLTEFDVVYLFADAVYEALRREASCKEGVLVTWAILADGSKVLLHMSAGSKESSESWLDHFRSLLSRGLNPPLTVTTDGAPGAIKAVEAIWPEVERIRCWVHKMRNVLDKLPEADHVVVKPYLQAVRDAPDYATGHRLAEETIAQFEPAYPSAMRSFADDLEASLAHLKLPPVHRKAVRTTNLVERSFVEERRRTKVLPRFWTEGACTKLVHAVLWRASERWRRVTFSELERRQIEQYRRLRQAQKGQAKLAAATHVA
jgi:putative transposase